MPEIGLYNLSKIICKANFLVLMENGLKKLKNGEKKLSFTIICIKINFFSRPKIAKSCSEKLY